MTRGLTGFIRYQRTRVNPVFEKEFSGLKEEGGGRSN